MWGQYISFIADIHQNVLFFTTQVETYLQPNNHVDNLLGRNVIPEKKKVAHSSFSQMKATPNLVVVRSQGQKEIKVPIFTKPVPSCFPMSDVLPPFSYLLTIVAGAHFVESQKCGDENKLKANGSSPLPKPHTHWAL